MYEYNMKMSSLEDENPRFYKKKKNYLIILIKYFGDSE